MTLLQHSLPPEKPEPAQVHVVFSQNGVSSELAAKPFPGSDELKGHFAGYTVMKDMILMLTLCLQPVRLRVSTEGTWEQGVPAKCFACGLLFTGVSLAAKHLFSCIWSFYSEKSNAKKKNCALSASSFFPLFCFSGSLWTLLELPVSAGTGTCEKLGFVTKGGLRNKCLDIQLQF